MDWFMIPLYLFSVGTWVGGMTHIFWADRKWKISEAFRLGLESAGAIALITSGVILLSPWASSACHVLVQYMFPDSYASALFCAMVPTDMGCLTVTSGRSTSETFAAILLGYTSGATLSFTLPMGLLFLPPEFHASWTIGVLRGLIGVPVGYACTVWVASQVSSISVPTQWNRPETATPSTLGSARDLIVGAWPVWLMYGFISLMMVGFPTRASQFVVTSCKAFTRCLCMAGLVAMTAYITQLDSWACCWPSAVPPFTTRSSEDGPLAAEVAFLLAITVAGAHVWKVWLDAAIECCASASVRTCESERSPIYKRMTSGFIAASFNILAVCPHWRSYESDEEREWLCLFASTCGFLLADHFVFAMSYHPYVFGYVILMKVTSFLAALGIHQGMKWMLRLLYRNQNNNNNNNNNNI